jgi:excisionase family DNA binding protein
MEQLLNKAEVALLLHVSSRTVDRLRAAGQLPSIRVRGAVRFKSGDIQAFIDTHKNRPQA